MIRARGVKTRVRADPACEDERMSPTPTALLSPADQERRRGLRIMKGVGTGFEVDDISHGVREVVTRLAA